jgi:aryl-alcohol dehydrogenase-like predicted oxidoreductase
LEEIPVEYSGIAGTDLQVSRIALGTWAIGGWMWGGRRPDQMDPVPEIMGWHLDQPDMHAIEDILKETLKDPVGPEFMGPPARRQA